MLTHEGNLPPLPVVQWKERNLFGVRKVVWVLPPVKVLCETPKEYGITDRTRARIARRSER